MAFGKGKGRGKEPGWESLLDEDQPSSGESDEPDGPFEIEDFDTVAVAKQGRHDLGAVLIPENESAELAVEVNQAGVATTVWMVTPNGRYNISAYAAPKAGGLWREVVTELAESLRNDGATVSIEDGKWGREVVGLVTNGPEPVAMRFIGVDGYRWMVRGAAIGTPASAEAIAADMRNALADTVVRRGDTPQPVRAQLPLQLSDALVARLRARAEQMTAEYTQQQTEQAQQVAPPQPPAPPPPPPRPPVQRQPPPTTQEQPQVERPAPPRQEMQRPAPSRPSPSEPQQQRTAPPRQRPTPPEQRPAPPQPEAQHNPPAPPQQAVQRPQSEPLQHWPAPPRQAVQPPPPAPLRPEPMPAPVPPQPEPLPRPDLQRQQHEELLRKHEELLRQYEELLRQSAAQLRLSEQEHQPEHQTEQQSAPVARRSEQGSAMQQLRTITGG